MKIESWSVKRPIPYSSNPRKNAAAIAKVKASIQAYGFRQPIVVDTKDVIIVGHTRLLAAQELGLTEVPVHVAEGLSPSQAKAYRLADNRSNEEAEWDFALLAEELAELSKQDVDLSLTGFDHDELNQILAKAAANEGLCDEDAVPDLPAEPVTKLGDLYQLGRHRLLCGDATSFEHVERLLDGNKPEMVYTDPPYGVSIVQGGWVGGGEANNIPFGGVKNESTAQRTARLEARVNKPARYAPVIGDDGVQTAIDSYNLCAALAIPVLIFWGGNYYASALPDSSCWLVWDKENNGNFADAELAWTNQKTAVRLFRHMWNGMVKASEHGQRRVHPTQKPVALAEWCFSLYGKPGDKVLDLFCGSGSTLLAAERTDRTAYLMELSPAYCDVIVKRFEDFTGLKAKLIS